MDRRLADRPYLAGEYSIADMACWPWVVPYKNQGQELTDFPNLSRWFHEVAARPAVDRGFKVGAELRQPAGMDEEAKKILFGQTAKTIPR
jgi:GST-like protein